jgi:hypothetical protein
MCRDICYIIIGKDYNISTFAPDFPHWNYVNLIRNCVTQLKISDTTLRTKSKLYETHMIDFKRIHLRNLIPNHVQFRHTVKIKIIL